MWKAQAKRKLLILRLDGFNGNNINLKILRSGGARYCTRSTTFVTSTIIGIAPSPRRCGKLLCSWNDLNYNIITLSSFFNSWWHDSHTILEKLECWLFKEVSCVPCEHWWVPAAYKIGGSSPKSFEESEEKTVKYSGIKWSTSWSLTSC
jgi:hypothetical protein